MKSERIENKIRIIFHQITAQWWSMPTYSACRMTNISQSPTIAKSIIIHKVRLLQRGCQAQCPTASLYKQVVIWDNGSPKRHSVRQMFLKLFGSEAQFQFTLIGNGDGSRFFTHYNREAIGLL